MQLPVCRHTENQDAYAYRRRALHARDGMEDFQEFIGSGGERLPGHFCLRPYPAVCKSENLHILHCFHGGVYPSLLSGKAGGFGVIRAAACFYRFRVYFVLVAVWLGFQIAFLKVCKSHQYGYGVIACLLCGVAVSVI